MVDKWQIERVIKTISEVSTDSKFVTDVTKYSIANLTDEYLKAIDKLYDIVNYCAIDYEETMKDKYR